MYTKILVPLDGSKLSEQILPYAQLLADAFHVPVELLHVNDLDTITPFAPPLQGGDYLKVVSKRYLPLSLTVSCTVDLGKPAELIVERAAADRGALIAMATRGHSGMQRWLLGSVSNKVVRTATNPLLLVRPPQGTGPVWPLKLKTILVPLDGSGLAEKILPHVTALAETLELEVNLLRVHTIPAESYIVGDGLYVDVLSRETESIRKGVGDYLNGKIEELQAEGLDRVSSVAVEGDPAEEIIDLARNTHDSLIAMSTHGRSGMERWVLEASRRK